MIQTPASQSPNQAPTGEGLWAWVIAHPRIFLVLLCLAFFVPGTFSLPPLDRDESRFAQASKQMLESGDYVNISFNDGARNKKPAGIHWMQSFTAWMAGGPEEAGIWAYRLPSAIGAVIAVLLLHWAARRLFDEETALLAAALMGAAMALVAETNISKTDGVLLATVVGMQCVLLRFYLARHGTNQVADDGPPGLGLAMAFWVAMGISLLIKGPIGPMVIGLTVVTISLIDRDWSWLDGLRWKMGLLIVAVLVLPWGISILIETGGVYYQESIGKDFTAKILSGQESHGAPPGYYLALVTITFFPGSLFLWPAFAEAWSRRLDPAFRFCLAWIIPSWIVFEIVPTKLPHYTLPTYPALALITAAVILLTIRGRPWILTSGLARANAITWTVIGLIIATFATLGPVIYGEGLEIKGLLLSLAGVGLVGTVALFVWRNKILSAVRTAIAAALVFYVSLLEITLPNLDWIAVSPRVAAALETHYGEDHRTWPHVASTGFVEPSLVFLTATRTRLAKPETAANHLSEVPDGVVLVEERKEPRFQARLQDLGIAVEVFDRVEGHNYSNGQDVSITFYRRASGAE